MTDRSNVAIVPHRSSECERQRNALTSEAINPSGDGRTGRLDQFWESRQGYRFPVPRHHEINGRLAKEILKQADQ